MAQSPARVDWIDQERKQRSDARCVIDVAGLSSLGYSSPHCRPLNTVVDLPIAMARAGVDPTCNARESRSWRATGQHPTTVGLAPFLRCLSLMRPARSLYSCDSDFQRVYPPPPDRSTGDHREYLSARPHQIN
nr:unnamed protein product [Digitaria exilis]